MSPASVFDFSKQPLGNSITLSNLIFQAKILFGLRSLFSATTLLSLSRIMTSIGNLSRKVWIPNLVLKMIPLAFFSPISPFIFPKAPFLKSSLLMIVFLVLFTSTSKLYKKLENITNKRYNKKINVAKN